MSSHEGDTSDAVILDQIRELAAGISDERTRVLMHNVASALKLSPQPIPRGILGTVLEAVALNPQPLPPSERADIVTSDTAPLAPGRDEVALNPQPIPPGILRTVLEAVALNPQPLPPEQAS
jgi:hypothetical protein